MQSRELVYCAEVCIQNMLPLGPFPLREKARRPVTMCCRYQVKSDKSGKIVGTFYVNYELHNLCSTAGSTHDKISENE